MAAGDISLATLTLTSTAPNGAFIGSVSQIGASDHLIEDIPLKTSNPPAYARGSYPLRWDQDYTNQVTVANTSDKTLRIGGSITAGTMVYVFEREDIAPGSTILLDVDKWRKDQVPDVNGKLLPLDAPFGKIHWIEMGLGKNAGLLGRQSLASVQSRRRSSFSCGSTCTYTYDGQGFYDPLPWQDFAVGDSLLMQVEEHVSMVNGSSYVYPSNDDTLFAESSGVISLSSSTQNGSTQVTESATGPGSVVLDFSIYADSPTYDPDMEQCNDNCSNTDESGSSNVATLSCSPLIVTRGSVVSCTASGTNSSSGDSGSANVTFGTWTFTDGSATVTSSTGSSSNGWTGIMVTSGTVSVTAYFADRSSQIYTTAVTVVGRSGYSFSAQPSTRVTTITNCANGAVDATPTATNNAGYACAVHGADFLTSTVPSGPNTGYSYISSKPTDTGSFTWAIAADADNPSSTFYQSQCGNYNASANTGFISGANFDVDLQRHEGGSVMSHYANYVQTINIQSYNVGYQLESVVAQPGQNINSAANAEITSTAKAATSNESAEPCGTHVANYTSACVYQGPNNFAPYAVCQ